MCREQPRLRADPLILSPPPSRFLAALWAFKGLEAYLRWGWGCASGVLISAAYRCGVRPESRQVGLNPALS